MISIPAFLLFNADALGAERPMSSAAVAVEWRVFCLAPFVKSVVKAAMQVSSGLPDRPEQMPEVVRQAHPQLARRRGEASGTPPGCFDDSL